MKDLSDIMRQAQEMQSKIAQAQEEMENVSAEGMSGGGMVRVTLKGKGDLADLTIDPSLAGDDLDMIEDLIKAAHADARVKLEKALADQMQKATGGLSGLMPGFKMPF